MEYSLENSTLTQASSMHAQHEKLLTYSLHISAVSMYVEATQRTNVYKSTPKMTPPF